LGDFEWGFVRERAGLLSFQTGFVLGVEFVKREGGGEAGFEAFD